MKDDLILPIFNYHHLFFLFSIYVSVVFLGEIFNYKFKEKLFEGLRLKLVMDNGIFFYKFSSSSVGPRLLQFKKYDLFFLLSRGTRVLVLFFIFSSFSSSRNWWRKIFVLTRGRNKKKLIKSYRSLMSFSSEKTDS